MEIKWLKTFIIAAQCENFRKASELLFLTQPAVTKHIQRLEEYLQGRLFERRGKTVMLSAEGHRFLPIAKMILARYEEGMTSFEAWRFWICKATYNCDSATNCFIDFTSYFERFYGK